MNSLIKILLTVIILGFYFWLISMYKRTVWLAVVFYYPLKKIWDD